MIFGKNTLFSRKPVELGETSINPRKIKTINEVLEFLRYKVCFCKEIVGSKNMKRFSPYHEMFLWKRPEKLKSEINPVPEKVSPQIKKS